MSTPLVATDGPADPLEPFDGAGVLSSAADVVSAARPLATGGQFSPSEFAAAGAGLAVDARDALAELAEPHPYAWVAVLAEPLVGWLIEHVSFIREPFDALAGDPGGITRVAETWHNIAGRLTEVADEQERLFGGPIGWEGEACDGYRAAAAAQVAALRRTAAEAENLAGEVMADGALVGTVRSLIRGLISELIARLLQWLVSALATATVTAGGTLAAAVPIVIAEALSTLRRIMGKVRELLEALGLATRRVAELAARAEVGLPKALGSAGSEGAALLGGPGSELTARAGDVALEAAKQGTKADREQAEWEPAPAKDGWVPLPSTGQVRRYGT